MFNQAKKLIEESQNISIFLPENYKFALTEGDIFCAGSALFYSLKNLGKKANLFFEKIPKRFQFLANHKSVISISTKKRDVSEISYEKDGDSLKIHLTSLQKDITPEDISLSSRSFPQNYTESKSDLLITLGVQNLENLEENFNRNPDLFYKTPILNIDNHPLNENFGEINLLEIKSCSISEITTDLIGFIDQSLINQDVATLLLAGTIWASENFRSPKTKPKTFARASALIEKGADHQKIIQNFYKTKSLSQIKLLGQVLKKLSFNPEKELYCSSLTKKDFEDSNSSSRDLGEVLQELKFNFGRQILTNLLILWESHNSPHLIKGVFYSSQKNSIEKILKNFKGISRGKMVLFLIGEKSLDSAYQKFIETM